MPMQLHELEAWLGDQHGLSQEQLQELLKHAHAIEETYPDPDATAERDEALAAAYRLTTDDEDLMMDVIEEYGQLLLQARQTEARALAGLRQATLMLVPAGEVTESAMARMGNVDRMTVRKWLGKRG